jgi:hypothetical protein
VIGPEFTLGRISPAVDLMGPNGVRAPDGSWVINAPSFHPEGIGLPLHRVDAQGRITLSFGADPPIEANGGSAFRRRPATSDSRWVWAVHQPRYRLEQWSRDGRRLAVFDREVEWFRPHVGGVRDPDTGAPLPFVVDLHQDREGLIWTAVLVPGSNWQDGLGSGVGLQGQRAVVVTDESALYDTVVEVIDPDTRSVVASQRFEQPFAGFVGDGLIYGLETVESGRDVRIGVWRVQRESR